MRAIWPLTIDGKVWALIGSEQFAVDHVWLVVLGKVL
jgi:hypothetical protein